MVVLGLYKKGARQDTNRADLLARWTEERIAALVIIYTFSGYGVSRAIYLSG